MNHRRTTKLEVEDVKGNTHVKGKQTKQTHLEWKCTWYLRGLALFHVKREGGGDQGQTHRESNLFSQLDTVLDAFLENIFSQLWKINVISG